MAVACCTAPFQCTQAQQMLMSTYPDLLGDEAATQVVLAVKVLGTKLGCGQTDQHVRLDAITVDIALLHIPACACSENNNQAIIHMVDSLTRLWKLTCSRTRGDVHADNWWRLGCRFDNIEKCIQGRPRRALHPNCGPLVQLS